MPSLISTNSDFSPQVEYGAARSQARLTTTPLLETSQADGEPWMAFYRRRRGYLVRIFKLVDFEVFSSGTQVTIHAVPGVSPHTVEHLYLNQALPLALSLQNKLVLHGSAVEIENLAVAFLGASGRGKSTLAASFSANGFRFLSDDGLLIDKEGNNFIIRPGHPSLRLRDDSREVIAKRPGQTESVIDHNAKSRFLADDKFSFCAENRALAHLYFLGDGSSAGVSITPVSSQKSVIEMMRHCFLLGVDERELLAKNFQRLAELAREPIFFNLDYPRRFDFLGQVREAVVKNTHVSSEQ